MRATLRRWAKAILPPVVADLVRRRRRRREWVRLPGGWDTEAQPGEQGWNVAGVAASYEAERRSFVEAARAPRPLGLRHQVAKGEVVGNDDALGHNLVMTYGYVLAQAARHASGLSVLDWGGGVGNYYTLSRELLPEAPFDYHCQEVPVVAAAGRRANPAVTFHDDGDSALARTYDLVLVSGALHYTRDWKTLLRRLALAAGPWLFVARVPVTDGEPFVQLQRAKRWGYETSYRGWVLPRDAVLEVAEASGMTLEREFIADGESRSFLWKRPVRRAGS